MVFGDGSSVLADTVIYCTGYNYAFPFLDTEGAVTVDDNRVGPLFEHVFPPSLAPSLSFVGIPVKVREPVGRRERVSDVALDLDDTPRVGIVDHESALVLYVTYKNMHFMQECGS